MWVGLLTRRHVGRIEDYLVANRGMGVYVGTASLVSTEIGIITYMYQAQFGFLAGFSAFVVGLITIAVCFAVGRTGFVITPLREMRVIAQLDRAVSQDYRSGQSVPGSSVVGRHRDEGMDTLAGLGSAGGGHSADRIRVWNESK